MRRRLALVSALAASTLALPIVAPSDVRAAAGGPVVIDGTDAGYHGSVFQGTLQSGWAYYGAWYATLTSAVSGSYSNDGRIAVIGAAASTVTLTDCGGGAHYAADAIGAPVDFYDGAANITAFLSSLRTGASRPRLVHIVEETTDPSAALCDNGLDASEASALTASADALAAHVNRGGALFSNDQTYGWLKALDPSITVTACGGFDPDPGSAGDSGFVGLGRDHRQVPYHTCFPTTGSLPVIASESNGAVILGGVSITLPTGGGGGGVAPPVETPIDRCDGWCVTRLAGDDRFATAVAVSKRYWPDGATTAVLSTGFNFPDAIVGGPLAARRELPVLLTRSNSLPDATRRELERLRVQSVIVTGGSVAVSADVVGELLGMGVGVTRLFGADRYETSAAVAGQWTSSATSSVVIASGTDFSAQLVAAHLAARQNAPLLVVRPDGSVPAAVADQIRRLAPPNIVVVGSVSTSGVGAVRSGDTVTSLTRPDVIELSIASQPVDLEREIDFMVASSADYPDALAGVAAATRARVPLLLSEAECATSTLVDFVDENELGRAVVLGGPRAIFDGISRLSPRCTS